LTSWVPCGILLTVPPHKGTLADTATGLVGCSEAMHQGRVFGVPRGMMFDSLQCFLQSLSRDDDRRPLPDDVPLRLHRSQPRRATRHGRSGSAQLDGLASRLGSPALAPGFERFLDRDPRSVDPDNPKDYRWPARAAIARISREHGLPGCPDRGVTLDTIARSRDARTVPPGETAGCGSDPEDIARNLRLLDKAASILALEFPAMADPKIARNHIFGTLRRYVRTIRYEVKRPT
jgi:hypothetical protein